ncbi:MAG: site-2 protease family protein [Candidatus Accumulibacter sp.]|jgi:Zn-dependent protease|nr:site-2 protease family protein [Accumulibacter sp.]
MNFQTLLLRVFIEAPPILFAITAHEMAHAFAACRFGDTTALRAGRLSLNPLRHIDVFGTFILPMALLCMNLPGFGWAKPVPVDLSRLRRPKQAMLMVAAAGPASNALMALAWTGSFKLAAILPYRLPAAALESMAVTGIGINLMLMTLNLLPLPPLDGGRIAVCLLPARFAMKLERMEPFGFFILIGLLSFGFLDRVLLPMVEVQAGFLFRIFNLEILF